MKIQGPVTSGNFLEIQGCWFVSSRVKDQVLHLTSPINKEEVECLIAQILEAAFYVFENTTVIPLGGDIIGYQFLVHPRAGKASAKQDQALMRAGLPPGQYYPADPMGLEVLVWGKMSCRVYGGLQWTNDSAIPYGAGAKSCHL